MSCTDILPLLSGHLDHANTEDEEALLLRHLKSCPDCRSLLAQMEQNNALLAASAQEPPADLTTRIMAQVRGSAAKPRRSRRFLPWLASGAAAAALFAFVLSGGVPAPQANDCAVQDEAVAEVDAYAQDAEGKDLLDTEDIPIVYALPTQAVEEPESSALQSQAVQEPPAIELPEGGEEAAPENGDLDSIPKVFRAPVAGKLDRSVPILIIWEASAADFDALEGLEPDSEDTPPLLFPKEILLDENFSVRIGELNPQADSAAIGGRRNMTMTVYTVSYDIFTAVLKACGEDYELTIFDPEHETQPEHCKIIFAVACDVLPCETQAS